MGFRGPSRGIDTSALLMPFNLRRQQEQDALDLALQQSNAAIRASSVMGESIDRDQRQQDAIAAGRERLAMDPSIRTGGRPSGLTVSDSPALQPRTFSRYGQSYTFDPAMGAAAEGEAMALKDTTAQSARIDALKRIPGITPAMASRMVFGRTGLEDIDGEQTALRTALADYVKTPGRDTAARAVQAGASLNQFPDRFLSGEASVPVRGTPEYMAMRQAELDQEAEAQMRLLEWTLPMRTEASVMSRAPQRDRLSRVVGPNGEIGVMNLDTQEVDWTGQMGAKPRGSSMLDQLIAQRGTPVAGAPVGVPVGQPVAPPAAAPAGRPAPAAPVAPVAPAGRSAGAPDTDGGAERQAFSEAYRRLRGRGIRNPTLEQVKAEMMGGAPRGDR